MHAELVKSGGARYGDISITERLEGREQRPLAWAENTHQRGKSN